MLSEIIYRLRLPMPGLDDRSVGDIVGTLRGDLPQGPWRIRRKPFVQLAARERSRDDWWYSVWVHTVPTGDWREDDMPGGPATAALALVLWARANRGVNLDIPWRTAPGAQEQDGFGALRVPAYLLVSNDGHGSSPDTCHVLMRMETLSDALLSADAWPVPDDSGLWLGVADIGGIGSPSSPGMLASACFRAWKRADREPNQPRDGHQEKACDNPR